MLRSCRNTYFSILIDILYSADCLLHHRWTRRSPASSSPIRSAMGKDLGQHSTATLWNKLSRPRSTPLSTGYSVENATFTSAIALTRAPDGMTRGGHGFDHDFLAVCCALHVEIPVKKHQRTTPGQRHPRHPLLARGSMRVRCAQSHHRVIAEVKTCSDFRLASAEIHNRTDHRTSSSIATAALCTARWASAHLSA